MSIYRPKNADGTFKSPYWHFDFVITVNGITLTLRYAHVLDGMSLPE